VRRRACQPVERLDRADLLILEDPMWWHLPPPTLYQVVVLGGLEGHRDAGHRAHLAAPHPGGVDHVLGRDRTPLGDDAGDPTAGGGDPGDGDVLDDPDTTHAGALGVGHRQVGGVDATLVGHVEGSQHVVGLRSGPEPAELGRGKERLRPRAWLLAVRACQPRRRYP